MRGQENAFPQVSFVWYHSGFGKILGPQPQVRLLADVTDTNEALFHEACVYDPLTNSVFVTSNQLLNPEHDPNSDTSDKQIRLFRIWDRASSEESTSEPDDSTPEIEELATPQIAASMLNGGVNLGPTSILFCAQGTRNLDDPSGLVVLQIPAKTSPSSEEEEEPTFQVLLKSFYGLPFNSVNDVIVHPDGTIWFTDPCYGYHQGIRPKPRLPNQVYRFNAKDKSVRVVATDFTRPNGLCFSPDLKTLYVTDTGAIHGSASVPIDPTGPSHIYAFDIVPSRTNTNTNTNTNPDDTSKPVEPFLTNRRTFAYAPGGWPDGIKCDTNGNVYSGCGDGIEVWNEDGVPLGVIKIEGGVANFCFGKRGAVYACNETKFWKITLNEQHVRGALLGV